MITEIKNINSKSFKDYTYSGTETFKNINIIFGTNGSGKSGLANWIKDQSTEATRVFDSEYVRQNIELSDEDGIPGVKLTAGKEAIKNAENLQIEKNKLNEFEGNKITQEEYLENKKASLYDLLKDTLLTAKKQFSLNSNINQKQNAKNDPIRALELWGADINENLDTDIGSSSKLETIKNNIETDIKTLIQINGISDDEFTQLKELLKEPLIKPSESVTSEQIEWLKTGLSLHGLNKSDEVSSHQEKCQFCGNSFDAVEIANKVQEKITSDYAIKIQELDSFKSRIKKIKNDLGEIPKDIKLADSVEQSEKILKSIENKQNSLLEPENIDSKFQTSLKTVNSEVQSREELKQIELKKINNQISNIEKVAKSWIGVQLRDNNQCKTLKKEIKSKQTEINSSEENIRSQKKLISQLEEATSDLKPFKELVERQFKVLGLELRLKISDDSQHYILEHKDSSITITTKDLSEGERRLFGFLHFYFNLWEKSEEELKESVEIVIFDDAITSLDSENRYYLTEQINQFLKLVSEKDKQVFVFTHSSLDFHNLGYGANAQTRSFWKITKSSKSSELVKVEDDERKNYSDYFGELFNQVFEFAIKSKNNLPDNFIEIGNRTRLILESHARTHYRIEMVTNNSIKKLMECYAITNGEKEKFSHAIDVINSLSHGFTYLDDENNEISASEVQDCAKEILSILYRKDSKQVESIVGKRLNKENRDNVLKWLNPDNDLEVSQ